MGFRGFDDCAIVFIIYYFAGATGFTNPWYGCPTEVFPLSYLVSGGTVTITGYTGSGETVVIPNTIDDAGCKHW